MIQTLADALAERGYETLTPVQFAVSDEPLWTATCWSPPKPGLVRPSVLDWRLRRPCWTASSLKRPERHLPSSSHRHANWPCRLNASLHGFTPKRRGDVDYIGQLEDDLADLITAKRQPRQKVILVGLRKIELLDFISGIAVCLKSMFTVSGPRYFSRDRNRIVSSGDRRYNPRLEIPAGMAFPCR